MDFAQALDKIFQDVMKSVEKNLEAHKKNALPDSSKPVDMNGSGSVDFDFHIDGNGNYHSEFEQYGAGVTVHCIAWVTDPDATYTVTITSSDGGGGHRENVHVNDKLTFDLKTSFWHKTKITVDGHASVINQDGHGHLDYYY